MEEKDKQQLKQILHEFDVIAHDTGLRIKKVKEFQQIRNIHRRMTEEQERAKPGVQIIEPQNRLSVYLTMRCFRHINLHS